jgi:hypothetical protein
MPPIQLAASQRALHQERIRRSQVQYGCSLAFRWFLPASMTVPLCRLNNLKWIVAQILVS